MAVHIRIQILLGFLLVVLGVLGFKALQQGWFAARPQLELNDQPTLLFFTLSDGCDCQMRVIRKAATQVAFWEPAESLRINVMRINFDERLDLARYFEVERAPALVLVDYNGVVFWMQDEAKSDGEPFDMAEVEAQIADMLTADGR